MTLAHFLSPLMLATSPRILAAIEATVHNFGSLNAICLNAGVPGGTSIGDHFDIDRYHQSMRVNLDAAVYGVNAALSHLRQRGGAILITSSIAGLSPSPDLYYSAAKHALIGLVRSLALLLRNDNITVNALCPGFIDTPVIANIRDSLIANGIAVASPDEIAAEGIKILEFSNNGTAWEVQAGKPARRIEFPSVTPNRRP